jgi:tRNA(fMet)-specific endonuclease VapC
VEWQDALMRYLLDSDTCIFALRDYPKVMSRLYELHPSEWAISSLTAFELHRGITKGLRADVARQTADFIQLAQVLPFCEKESKLAAEIELRLKMLGKPMGVVDVLIASHALSHSLTLVTNNAKHFENVPELKLENWL